MWRRSARGGRKNLPPQAAAAVADLGDPSRAAPPGRYGPADLGTCGRSADLGGRQARAHAVGRRSSPGLRRRPAVGRPRACGRRRPGFFFGTLATAVAGGPSRAGHADGRQTSATDRLGAGGRQTSRTAPVGLCPPPVRPGRPRRGGGCRRPVGRPLLGAGAWQTSAAYRLGAGGRRSYTVLPRAGGAGGAGGRSADLGGRQARAHAVGRRSSPGLRRRPAVGRPRACGRRRPGFFFGTLATAVAGGPSRAGHADGRQTSATDRLGAGGRQTSRTAPVGLCPPPVRPGRPRRGGGVQAAGRQTSARCRRPAVIHGITAGWRRRRCRRPVGRPRRPPGAGAVTAHSRMRPGWCFDGKITRHSAASVVLLKIRARRGVLITRRLAACDCLIPVFLGRRRIGIACYCDGARSIKGRPMGTNFERNHRGERLG